MAIRLHFIVEGQTEETFANKLLGPHLEEFSVWLKARCVTTKRERGLKYRGGVANYAQAKNDINDWLRQDQSSDARFTTMFDLYALPNDFPGYADAAGASSPYDRVRILEDALRHDISDWRFIPYIQLHEFEALLLSNPQKLESLFYERSAEIYKLIAMAGQFASPELINDGVNTAPSKQIVTEIPRYKKAYAGPSVAESIGLPTLRSKCEHFGAWLGRLESLE